jgi:hypothetical protein
MIIEVESDSNKSKSLKYMAEMSLERLNNTNKLKYPSNTLIDYYDIIHKLLEALTLKIGVKFKGDGAHRELIDFISEKYLTENSRIFLQEMREYRNSISYEGFIINPEYIGQNEKKINEIIEKLLKKI